MRVDPVITVPYFNPADAESSPRYRWNNWERGNRPYVILQWTLSGEGQFRNAQGDFAVPDGSAFVAIVPERSTYGYPAGRQEPWAFGWLNFYGELACNLCAGLRAEFGAVVPLPRRSAAAASLRRLMLTVEKRGRADRWQVSLLAYAFLLEWWRELAQPPRLGKDRLERAIRFCRERFREPLSTKELAEEAGMSREYFSRSFTARTRETPAAFLRRLRLEEASALLKETLLPLEEVAMRSGFYSARHLMLTCQRVYGRSPSALRNDSGQSIRKTTRLSRARKK